MKEALQMADHVGENERIRRFGVGRIFEHGLHMVLFVALVTTGLAQKFYMLDASQWFIMRLQGIDNVRFLHHLAGFVFTAAAAAHAIAAVAGVAFRKWQPTMVISRKDIDDAIHNIRYYLGMEDRQALCDRYDYKEKFEYWNILIGGVLMIVSGLILLYPAFVTRFLPGEFIPAAKVLHTNEALLVLLIIALWHIYNSIFSPEVFPFNTSIFTGYTTREGMAREHPIELARIEGRPVEVIVANRDADSPRS